MKIEATEIVNGHSGIKWPSPHQTISINYSSWIIKGLHDCNALTINKCGNDIYILGELTYNLTVVREQNFGNNKLIC